MPIIARDQGLYLVTGTHIFVMVFTQPCSQRDRRLGPETGSSISISLSVRKNTSSRSSPFKIRYLKLYCSIRLKHSFERGLVAPKILAKSVPFKSSLYSVFILVQLSHRSKRASLKQSELVC